VTRYIAGQPASFVVAAADAATVQASAFAAAVNAGYTQFNIRMGFPVVATVAGAVVTLTARHAGSYGNAIRIESGLQGETDPAGVAVSYAGGAAVSGTINAAYTLGSGSGEVDLAAALALLGTLNAEWISGPWGATAQLNATQTFLANSGTGRWSPVVQQGGHYITALPGTLTTLTTAGAARNDPHATILGIRNIPAAPWVVAAAVAGVVARSKNLGAPLSQATEIARPLQTIALDGILAPYNYSDYWARADRESLYRNGIAAYTVSVDGTVRLERLVTTYQTNPYGTPDTTWLDVETLAISQYVGRYMRHRIESLYPRCVLVDENPNNNQGVATPSGVRASIIHAYTELAGASLVENVALFAKYLIVNRDSDPNRLDAFLPVDVANQLRVFAANVTIYLQMTDALLGG
jgi:phage tail sheath gpL-like